MTKLIQGETNMTMKEKIKIYEEMYKNDGLVGDDGEKKQELLYTKEYEKKEQELREQIREGLKSGRIVVLEQERKNTKEGVNLNDLAKQKS